MVRPLLQRLIEARFAPPLPPKLPDIPHDLLMIASKWRDPWARESSLKAMSELFETVGDWDKVRLVYMNDDAAAAS